MYQPPAFKETRRDVLLEAIAKHPLATLVCNTADGITANHLPMVVDGDKTQLHAHLSRGNELYQQCEDGVEALAIFQGPAAYISADWYPGKQEHGKEVPTYNYVVVHVRGKLHFRHEASWKLHHLKSLTDMMEYGRATPWSLSDAPADYVARQLKGLYGLELEITEMAGKWKMSQNRKDADKLAVAEKLHQEGDATAVDVAAIIKANT